MCISIWPSPTTLTFSIPNKLEVLVVGLLQSSDDRPYNWAIAPLIPVDSQPVFCLEPKLAGSCKNKTARNFYNAKWLWREQKQLQHDRGLLKVLLSQLHEDLLHTGRVPGVRQGAGHWRRGRAGQRGGAQGATHHSPCTVSSSSLLPGGEAAVSCETHTERVLQGENGRRSTPVASLWSSEPDHMLPFLSWEQWFSHPPGQVCGAPQCPT